MAVLFDIEDNNEGIVRLILNDQKRRNALSMELLETLPVAMKEIQSDPNTRVLIIAAQGPAFSAGHDLKELTRARAQKDKGLAFFTKTMGLCSELMETIVCLPRPVIAEVAGVATAAGCQLVASCDLAMAGQSARFATPGVNIGLFCSTPMVALSRNISNKHAMEMLLTGDMISADTAKNIGLVNHVVADGDLKQETLNLAMKIASKSSKTLAIGKEAFYRQNELSLHDAYQYCAAVMVKNLMNDNAVEGISAFLEKRPPTWQD